MKDIHHCLYSDKDTIFTVNRHTTLAWSQIHMKALSAALGIDQTNVCNSRPQEVLHRSRCKETKGIRETMNMLARD